MRIVIAGGGEVALLIARRLIREGNEIVIIEENAERCAHLEELLDARILRGSAASVRVLREAGLKDAHMLIAVTSVDEVNLFACMVAQAEFQVKVKVARLRTPEVGDWRRICRTMNLHIDLIIQPEIETAHKILRVLNAPGLSDIIDFAEGRVKLFGMNIEQDNWVAGKTVDELDRAGPPKNSLIGLIFRGQQVIIPHGGQTLEAGDHVYVLTRKQDFDEVLRFMGVPPRQELELVFILGGKQAGIWVAQELERQGVRVKLFERDAKRCEKISTILEHTIVVHADGTDETTLLEENIQSASAYLAMTNDDEDNLIASMLARRLGAKKVVALVNRLNYLPMAQRLGINTSVSPRLTAVDHILQYVRKGRVVSVTTFREEEAEAIEMIAAAGSPYLGRKLKDLQLPRDAIVGAIARTSGEVIVPRGDAMIEQGDRVIFLTLQNTVAKLESAFLAKGGWGKG